MNESASNTLRACKFWSAVNHAVADAGDGIEAEIFFEPANDKIAAGAVIGGFDGQFLGGAIFVFDSDGGIGKADAFEFS